MDCASFDCEPLNWVAFEPFDSSAAFELLDLLDSFDFVPDLDELEPSFSGTGSGR